MLHVVLSIVIIKIVVVEKLVQFEMPIVSRNTIINGHAMPL